MLAWESSKFPKIVFRKARGMRVCIISPYKGLFSVPNSLPKPSTTLTTVTSPLPQGPDCCGFCTFSFCFCSVAFSLVCANTSMYTRPHLRGRLACLLLPQSVHLHSVDLFLGSTGRSGPWCIDCDEACLCSTHADMHTLTNR